MTEAPSAGSPLTRRDIERCEADMTFIADAWADLVDRLARESHPGGEKVTGTRTPGLVLNEHVSQVMREVSQWVHVLATELLEHTDWTPPREQDTPILLHHIVKWRLGYFTHSAGPEMAEWVADRANLLRGKVTRAAYPDGYHTIDTRIPCNEHGTTEAGERVPCPGTYTVRPRRDGYPDMICSEDREHRIPPSEWSRGAWRVRHAEPAALLLRAIRQGV